MEHKEPWFIKLESWRSSWSDSERVITHIYDAKEELIAGDDDYYPTFDADHARRICGDRLRDGAVRQMAPG